LLQRGEEGEAKITYLNIHFEPYKVLPFYLHFGRTKKYPFIPQILSEEDLLIFSCICLYGKLNHMKWKSKHIPPALSLLNTTSYCHPTFRGLNSSV
jgi:hypothetical protein